MKKKPETGPTLANINAAARQCGMSYGKYVWRTGGAVPPPPELVAEVDSSMIRCGFCHRLFSPVQSRQVYCCAYCRKADYDRRVRSGEKQAAQN